MSNYTKAWVLVREVPDQELRNELIAAHERMLDAAADLEADDDFDGAIASAMWNHETLSDIAGKLDCTPDQIEDWVTDAQEQIEKLKPKEGEPTTDEALRKKLADALERIEGLEAERALLKAEAHQLEAAAYLSEDLRTSVGDVLAMSRKLTSFCERAGIKPATLRVTRTRRKAS
jgi:transposase-like protein